MIALNELHPDLRSSLIPSENCWMVHHPLVVEFAMTDEDIARINRIYTAKREGIAKVRDEGDWEIFMHLHTRAYRIDVFDLIKDHLSDETYWRTLGWLYVDQEFVHNQWAKLRKLFQSPRLQRHLIMSEADRATFADLPDELTLYRGYNKGKGLGWSWTLSEEIAIWFTHRFEVLSPHPRLLVGTARKQDATAYFGDRDEQEILIDPKLVTVNEKRKLEVKLHHE